MPSAHSSTSRRARRARPSTARWAAWVAPSRALIERVLKEGRTVYGVNTGFGQLKSVRIPDDAVERLQINLIRSHACGSGPDP